MFERQFYSNEKVKLGQLFDVKSGSFSRQCYRHLWYSIHELEDHQVRVYHQPVRPQLIEDLVDNNSLEMLKAHLGMGIYSFINEVAPVSAPLPDVFLSTIPSNKAKCALISVKFVFKETRMEKSLIRQFGEIVVHDDALGEGKCVLSELRLGKRLFIDVYSGDNDEVEQDLKTIQVYIQDILSTQSRMRRSVPDAVLAASTEFEFRIHNLNKKLTFEQLMGYLGLILERRACTPVSGTFCTFDELELAPGAKNDSKSSKNDGFDRPTSQHDELYAHFHRFEYALSRLHDLFHSYQPAEALADMRTDTAQEIMKKGQTLADLSSKCSQSGVLHDVKQMDSILNSIRLEKDVGAQVDSFCALMASMYQTRLPFFKLREQETVLACTRADTRICLVVAETDQQRVEFINFVVNMSQFETYAQAIHFKHCTYLTSAAQASPETTACILYNWDPENAVKYIFLSVPGLLLNKNNADSTSTSKQLAKLLYFDQHIHAVTVLFSSVDSLKDIQAALPSQLDRVPLNSFYFNLFKETPVTPNAWRETAEQLSPRVLYTVRDNLLAMDFDQMDKDDCGLALDTVRNYLRKLTGLDRIQVQIPRMVTVSAAVYLESVVIKLLERKPVSEWFLSRGDVNSTNDGSASRLPENAVDCARTLGKLCKYVDEDDVTLKIKKLLENRPKKKQKEDNPLMRAFLEELEETPVVPAEVWGLVESLSEAFHGPELDSIVAACFSVGVVSCNSRLKIGTVFDQFMFCPLSDHVFGLKSS